jgi:large subunit ribosomal protein L30
MKKLQVTLKKSVIGSTDSQRATVKGLGLRKIRDTRVLNNTPAIRGMIKKVIHLVNVEEVEVEE